MLKRLLMFLYPIYRNLGIVAVWNPHGSKGIHGHPSDIRPEPSSDRTSHEVDLCLGTPDRSQCPTVRSRRHRRVHGAQRVPRPPVPCQQEIHSAKMQETRFHGISHGKMRISRIRRRSHQASKEVPLITPLTLPLILPGSWKSREWWYSCQRVCSV